jgi:hypothetical protein
MLNVAPDVRFFTETIVYVITTNAVDSHALYDLHYPEWMDSDFRRTSPTPRLGE